MLFPAPEGPMTATMPRGNLEVYPLERRVRSPGKTHAYAFEAQRPVQHRRHCLIIAAFARGFGTRDQIERGIERRAAVRGAEQVLLKCPEQR